MSTPSTRRSASRCSARARCQLDSEGEFATSKLTAALESLVLTDCPPGPLERENRHVSSLAGIASEPRTWRSSSAMCPACRHEDGKSPSFGPSACGDVRAAVGQHACELPFSSTPTIP